MIVLDRSPPRLPHNQKVIPSILKFTFIIMLLVSCHVLLDIFWYFSRQYLTYTERQWIIGITNESGREPKDAPLLLEVSRWSHVDSSASPTVPLQQIIVTSNRTTTPTVSAQNNNTAIVFTAAYLTECKAMRLEYLLQTAPSSMDIWLLHNHNVTKKIYPNRFQKSSIFLRILKERFPRLHEVNQQSEPLDAFDTSRSGTSKSSFVKWVVSHPKYQHAWNFEDDVWLTGRWDLFLKEYESRDDDFVGFLGRRKPHWNQYESCHFDRISSAIAESSKNETNITTINSTVIDRVQCKEIASLGALWSLLRISRQFAALLLDDIQSGAIYGHHETVVHPLMLRHHHLTSHDIMESHIGVMAAGGHGKFLNGRKLNLTFLGPVSSNRLYHPVKCEAYEKDAASMEQLKALLTSIGWKAGRVL
ncbi:hypothetical protein IV203_028965 [Nitzschia inconspicua]|uniref:Uncharacterized protein n=1 Tax=Nitzschia inconspicua TaxID=303405 RepID=A0A9K3Q0S1_9STRA|nr:hypothetical protein IV203_028965 [Nitzschia inconspicua]